MLHELHLEKENKLIEKKFEDFTDGDKILFKNLLQARVINHSLFCGNVGEEKLDNFQSCMDEWIKKYSAEFKKIFDENTNEKFEAFKSDKDKLVADIVEKLGLNNSKK